MYSQLQSIISERVKSNSSDEPDSNSLSEKVTQIICFVLDDYDIKEKAFSKYIPEAPKEGENYENSLGLTFVFIQKKKVCCPNIAAVLLNLMKLFIV